MSGDRPTATSERRRSVLISADPGAERIAAWDRLVDATPGSDVTQLSAWARFRRHYGFDSLYLVVRDGSRLVAGAQVLHRRIRPIGTIGYVPFGPIVDPDVADHAHIAALLARELTALACGWFRMLIVQPPNAAAGIGERLLQQGFRRSTDPLVMAGSVQVDLTASEERLRRNLSKSVRRWTNKWAEAGVTVRTGDHRDLPLLADLMARSAEHQGFTPLSEEYITTLYRQLAPEHVVLFVGEVHGIPRAAEMHTLCGGVAKARLTGIDRSSDAAKLQLTAAITWTAIRWARDACFLRFDLGGLGEGPLSGLVDGAAHQESDWDGGDRFKLKFGGTAFRYPATVELIRPWPARRAYELARHSQRGRRLVERTARRLRGGRT
ncbi:peptidoglycan bridge formation glycyltransferase FemA/FemB family protein [Haloechinothrix sp. LS1_15]|uniref:lipid II:glycine glycyltransferase FemX n=1 Tax=Haloechinothrix sp. LS1_15 TaxID=2652248 RepID=UPI00294B1F03|nr:peptidoglycan bridge formation glycyltransferase FemA/FemB family protein [Haloechinothrix sp. LS1_15]